MLHTFAPVFKVIVAMVDAVVWKDEYRRVLLAMAALYWIPIAGRKNCGGPHDMRKEMGPEFALRNLTVDPKVTRERVPDNDR